MKRLLLGLLMGVTVLAVSVRAATITPVVTYTSASINGETRPFTVGFEFATTKSFNLNALGYFDDGNGFSHQVGIWNSAGNLLVSTTVLPTDPLQNNFLWNSISYTLSPGTYVIGGQTDENGQLSGAPVELQGVSTLPGYKWIEDRQVLGAGLNFPTDTFGIYGNNGILAVDLSVAGAAPAPIPEPTTLLLLGSGLVAEMIRRKLHAS